MCIRVEVEAVLPRPTYGDTEGDLDFDSGSESVGKCRIDCDCLVPVQQRSLLLLVHQESKVGAQW